MVTYGQVYYGTLTDQLVRLALQYVQRMLYCTYDLPQYEQVAQHVADKLPKFRCVVVTPGSLQVATSAGVWGCESVVMFWCGV